MRYNKRDTGIPLTIVACLTLSLANALETPPEKEDTPRESLHIIFFINKKNELKNFTINVGRQTLRDKIINH